MKVHAQTLLHMLREPIGAHGLTGLCLAHTHGLAPRSVLPEVVIERDDAVHLGPGEVQFLRQDGYRGGRDEPQLGLDAVENLDESAGARAVGRYDAEHGFPLSWSKG